MVDSFLLKGEDEASWSHPCILPDVLKSLLGLLKFQCKGLRQKLTHYHALKWLVLKSLFFHWLLTDALNPRLRLSTQTTPARTKIFILRSSASTQPFKVSFSWAAQSQWQPNRTTPSTVLQKYPFSAEYNNISTEPHGRVGLPKPGADGTSLAKSCI